MSDIYSIKQNKDMITLNRSTRRELTKKFIIKPWHQAQPSSNRYKFTPESLEQDLKTYQSKTFYNQSRPLGILQDGFPSAYAGPLCGNHSLLEKQAFNEWMVTLPGYQKFVYFTKALEACLSELVGPLQDKHVKYYGANWCHWSSYDNGKWSQGADFKLSTRISTPTYSIEIKWDWEEDIIDIHLIGVTKPGQGLGTKLMEIILAVCKLSKYKRVSLVPIPISFDWADIMGWDHHEEIPFPTKNFKRINSEKLISFYEMFGFTFSGPKMYLDF